MLPHDLPEMVRTMSQPSLLYHKREKKTVEDEYKYKHIVLSFTSLSGKYSVKDHREKELHAIKDR